MQQHTTSNEVEKTVIHPACIVTFMLTIFSQLSALRKFNLNIYRYPIWQRHFAKDGQINQSLSSL